jgi:hypothetical protein
MLAHWLLLTEVMRRGVTRLVIQICFRLEVDMLLGTDIKTDG